MILPLLDERSCKKNKSPATATTTKELGKKNTHHNGNKEMKLENKHPQQQRT
jgi:hypothetical protein